MPGKHRRPAQKSKHREQIADMRLKSCTINQIVRELGISRSTVKRELRSLQEEWRANAAESIDTHRQRELARLELVEREAFAEWERSKQDYVKEVTEESTDSEGGGSKHKRETGGRIGDPRLLEIAIRAQDARRKMLGLDAPTKVAPTTPDGENPYQPAKMPDAELDARIAELVAKHAKAA